MAYRANHIASKCYLARWADREGNICAVRPPNVVAELRKPVGVGFRRDFWGRDANVRRIAEQVSNRIESDAARALPRLAVTWPLEPGSRDELSTAFLIALHLVRNPHGRARFVQTQREVLRRRLSHYAAGWSQAQTAEFLTRVTSDAFWVESVLGDLHKIASLLTSMHWTLLAFDDPLLATSDQPVTTVGLVGEGEPPSVAPLPRGPIIETEEVRVALGPRHALLLTWLDAPVSTAAVRATDEVAAQLNRAVIAQADRQWFYNPARRPTSLAAPRLDGGPCRPLGRMLLEGYGCSEAHESRRRRDTAANLEAMVEQQVDGEVRVVRVRAAS